MNNSSSPLRILFLGNSLMYYNDMPGIFASIAGAAGKNVCVDSVTKGSATMAQFADSTSQIGAAARKKLEAGHWDYVIAEPSRRITPDEDTVFRAETAAAAALKALADASGAKLMLYDVWGNNDGNLGIFRMSSVSASEKIGSRRITRAEHNAFIHSVNLRIAKAIGGARLIPAGLAFEKTIRTAPEINLYHTDNRHPSLAGSYLVACVSYGVIFGEHSSGLSLDAGLPDAAVLQNIADGTVFRIHNGD